MEEARAGEGSSRPFLTGVGHLWACGSPKTCATLIMCSQVGHMEAKAWVGWGGGGQDASGKQNCVGPGNAPSGTPSFLPLPHDRM